MRKAAAAVALGAQMDRKWPDRKKRPAMEGIIGDAAHRSRRSDHNPAPCGCCHARDVTYDARYITPALAARLSKDPRVKYTILLRRIYRDGKGKPYGGSNPHTDHMHVSFVDGHTGHNNTRAFALDTAVPYAITVLKDSHRAELVPFVLKARLMQQRVTPIRLSGNVFVTAIHSKRRNAIEWFVKPARAKGIDFVDYVPTTGKANILKDFAAKL